MGPSAYEAAVTRALSVPRLAAYRLNGGEGAGMLLGRYLWNIALAEALTPALHLLEIGLRNRVDQAVTSIAGPAWFDDPNVVVGARERDRVAEARAQVTADKRTPERDRVIAELRFGFWVGLFRRQYETGPGRPANQIALWPRLAPSIVVAGPRGLRVRSLLAQQLGGFRILRNRTYHHEPIWRGRRDPRGVLVPLSVDHGNITRLIAAMCPELSDALALIDRFDDLYDRGPDTFVRAATGLCAA